MLRAAVRPLARQAVVARQARALHIENVVDHAMPVNVTNKPLFALKFMAYIATGFGLPFFASWFHIQKAAGN